MVVDNSRLSWTEIKNRYPHRYVGLSDVEYGINKATVKSAIVACTSDERNYEEMLELYLENKILLRYTTLDEDELEGVINI